MTAAFDAGSVTGPGPGRGRYWPPARRTHAQPPPSGWQGAAGGGASGSGGRGPGGGDATATTCRTLVASTTPTDQQPPRLRGRDPDQVRAGVIAADLVYLLSS